MTHTERHKNFIATSAVSQGRLVKLSSASGTHVEHNGAGQTGFVGVALHDAAAGKPVAVLLRGPWSTAVVVAAEAFDAGATLYAAASGKVKDSADGAAIGTALSAATADGDYVEMLVDAGTGASGIGPDQLANAHATDLYSNVVLLRVDGKTASGDHNFGRPNRKLKPIAAVAVLRNATTSVTVKLKIDSTDISLTQQVQTADMHHLLSIKDDVTELTTGATLKLNLSATATAAGVDCYVLCQPVA